MAKLLLLLFVCYILLDEVGSFKIITNKPVILVEVTHDAILRWEYELKLPDENVGTVYVGYYDHENKVKYIAVKNRVEDVKYTPSATDYYSVRSELASKVELTVKNVQLSKDGWHVKYFCRVLVSSKTGGEKDYLIETTVQVVELPKIIEPTNSDHTVVEKYKISSTQIVCRATGTPLPVVSWFKDGKPAKNGNGNILSLYNLHRDDKGIYVCKASSIAGNASFTVNLVIQYAPIINKVTSSNKVNSYLNNGKTVYLWCHAEGEPEPTYHWVNPIGFDKTNDKKSNKYPLQQPKFDEFGPWRCKANNSVGFDEHIVTVHQIKQPRMVNMTVNNIEQREATAQVQLPVNLGEGSLKEMVLSYRRLGHPKKEKLIELKENRGVKQIHLKGLIPYTKYLLDVTVTNEFFTSAEQRFKFITKEDVPGPPQKVQMLAVSPDQMNISWQEPVYKNGKDIYYRVVLRDVGNNASVVSDEKTKDTFLSVTNLTSYTEYSASVATGNMLIGIGFGNWSDSIMHRTKAIAPAAPYNIKLVMNIKDKKALSYNVTWSAPVRSKKEKAALTKYKIKSVCKLKERGSRTPRKSKIIEDLLLPSTTNTTTIQRSRVLKDLAYFSTCEIAVCEGAGKEPVWGKLSVPKMIETPETHPDKPRNLFQASSSHDHIWLRWDRPKRINGELKEFKILYYDNHDPTKKPLVPLVEDMFNQTFYYRLNLKELSNYTIEIKAGTELYDSEPAIIDVYTSERPVPAVSAIRKDGDGNAGPVVGGVLTVLFILVLAAVILLYIVRKKKRFNRANSSNSDAGFFPKGDRGNIHLVDGPLSPPSITKSAFMNDYVKNAQCQFTPKNPIPITSLKNYVQKYHENKAFIEEFRSIKSEVVESLDISSRAENKCKNRYANILAYDHSRVVLNTVEDLEGSDYVNANYIDGYNRKAKFIATQGPVVAAFNDFWRMIWEQDTDKIIMVTNLVEKSRIKCQKYWPCESEKGALYGNIKVQMIEELPLAEYIVRRFSITQMKDGSEIASRTVTQYQFLSWPDHGVPHYPTALLQFVKRVRSLDQGTTGPIVCHCSAGVGRTGTYITLDAMLDQIESEKTVDVVGYVTHIRGQRQLMVQTEAQYIYIYDTLLEAVSCGNTEVSTGDLFARIKHLDSINPGTTQTYMQEEFERLSFNIGDTSDDYEAALLPCNEGKNRYAEVLPYELTRLKLWPYANIEGSDYINASFIDGYQQREAYILTQSPLETTVEDFWRMLWEYEVFTIVMISSPTERSKNHCYPYWPVDNANNDSTLFGILAVQLAAEEEKVGFIRREFRVTNSKNGESRTISHFMYFNWPLDGSPDTASAIDMIGQVQKTQQQTGNSAIIIHCSDGSGRSGSLAALMYCLERLKLEGLVDIFQTVRQMRTQRVGLVQSLEQYHFIYMAVSNFLDCFSNYSNFK